MRVTAATAYKSRMRYLKRTLLRPMETTTMNIYEKVIKTLSGLRLSQSAEELNVIIRVGVFMARREKQRFLKFYLRILYGEIVAHTDKPPSSALTILLNIYNHRQIIYHVRILMELYYQEDNILRTAHCLFEWLRSYNFCEDLSVWILVIYQKLRKQQRFSVVDKISNANIEKIFMLFISTDLRPRIASIVFQMLGHIDNTPQIFLKILPQVPMVVNHLKKNPTGIDRNGRDTYVYAKDLVFVTYTLMKRFSEFEDIYVPVKMALELLDSSMNFNNVAYAAIQREPAPLEQHVGRCGLVNLGNNCYLNSVVQVLAMTNEFSRELLLIPTQSIVLQEMQKLIAMMHHSLRGVAQPTTIMYATHPIYFTPGEQQDSSEFLGHLLNQLHDQEITPNYQEDQHPLLTEFSVAPPTPPPAAAAQEALEALEPPEAVELAPAVAAAVEELLDAPMVSEEESSLSGEDFLTVTDRAFAGKVSTMYKCLTCGTTSRNDDSFRELQLSFPEHTSRRSLCSVQSLVDMYCSPESLDGENQYYCRHCQCLRDGERCIQMIQAPRNIILTLKQFNFEKQKQIRTKLMHKVFHNETIYMKRFSKHTLDEVAIVQYSLYAVVVHKGLTLDAGHYFTLARDHFGDWYKFDDSNVSTSLPNEIHSLKSPNTPYILFYKMCGISHDLIDDDPVCSMQSVSPNCKPLELEELPLELRNYVTLDNQLYEMENIKAKKKKQ